MRQYASSLSKRLILVVETQDFGSMLIFENHNHLKYMIKKFGALFASQIHQNVSKQVKLVEMDNFCCSVPSFAPCLILKVMIMSTMKPKNFKGNQHGEWIKPAKLRDISYLMTTRVK